MDGNYVKDFMFDQMFDLTYEGITYEYMNRDSILGNSNNFFVAESRSGHICLDGGCSDQTRKFLSVFDFDGNLVKHVDLDGFRKIISIAVNDENLFIMDTGDFGKGGFSVVLDLDGNYVKNNKLSKSAYSDKTCFSRSPSNYANDDLLVLNSIKLLSGGYRTTSNHIYDLINTGFDYPVKDDAFDAMFSEQETKKVFLNSQNFITVGNDVVKFYSYEYSCIGDQTLENGVCVDPVCVGDQTVKDGLCINPVCVGYDKLKDGRCTSPDETEMKLIKELEAMKSQLRELDTNNTEKAQSQQPDPVCIGDQTVKDGACVDPACTDNQRLSRGVCIGDPCIPTEALEDGVCVELVCPDGYSHTGANV